MLILGRGVREIDRQLMYSAAWLDDPRPDLERGAHVRVLDVTSRPRASGRSRRRSQSTGT